MATLEESRTLVECADILARAISTDLLLVSQDPWQDQERVEIEEHSDKDQLCQKERKTTEGGVCTNFQDKDGGSALITACQNRDVQIVSHLLEEGADTFLKDSKGTTAFDIAVEKNDPDILHLFAQLRRSPNYPGIVFSEGAKRESVSTDQKTIDLEEVGISLSIPKDTLSSTDPPLELEIWPCFSGPFELPQDVELVSPAYIVKPSRKVSFRKKVLLRIWHHVNLETEEDCEDMVFLSASTTPEYRGNSPVYIFREIRGAKGLFRPGEEQPVGEIALKHFCTLALGKRKREVDETDSEEDVSKYDKGNLYSVRLYRAIERKLVFCICLYSPMYTKTCNKVIAARYGSSMYPEECFNGVKILSNGVYLHQSCKSGWIAVFNKHLILKEEISVQELYAISDLLEMDYPPKIEISIQSIPKSSDAGPLCLHVEGLNREHTFTLYASSLHNFFKEALVIKCAMSNLREELQGTTLMAALVPTAREMLIIMESIEQQLQHSSCIHASVLELLIKMERKSKQLKGETNQICRQVQISFDMDVYVERVNTFAEQLKTIYSANMTQGHSSVEWQSAIGLFVTNAANLMTAVKETLTAAKWAILLNNSMPTSEPLPPKPQLQPLLKHVGALTHLQKDPKPQELLPEPPLDLELQLHSKPLSSYFKSLTQSHDEDSKLLPQTLLKSPLDLALPPKLLPLSITSPETYVPQSSLTKFDHTDDECSALITASQNTDVQMVSRLLEEGADTFLKDSKGMTALDIAVEKNDPDMLHLFAKLRRSPNYPGIVFSEGVKREFIVTDQKTINLEEVGISLSIPKDAQSSADPPLELEIRPCFSGPFEPPQDIELVSPAYIVKLNRNISSRKEVLLRIWHYANLETEEDCKDMMFLSASTTPEYRGNSPVYVFREIRGAKGLFRPGEEQPVGEIALKHFCITAIGRHKRKGDETESKENVSKCNQGNLYSARLYIRAIKRKLVFCICLYHPQYIKNCNEVIAAKYGTPGKRIDPDEYINRVRLISSEIHLRQTCDNGWIAVFKKIPASISKEEISAQELYHISDILEMDYPPKIEMSIISVPNSPDAGPLHLHVEGLDRESAFLLYPSDISSREANNMKVLPTSSSEPTLTVSQPCLTRDHIAAVCRCLFSLKAKWRTIGIFLCIDPDTLDAIRASNEQLDDQLTALISVWLRRHTPPPTWQALADAVHYIDPNKAQEIRTMIM